MLCALLCRPFGLPCITQLCHLQPASRLLRARLRRARGFVREREQVGASCASCVRGSLLTQAGWAAASAALVPLGLKNTRGRTQLLSLVLSKKNEHALAHCGRAQVTALPTHSQRAQHLSEAMRRPNTLCALTALVATHAIAAFAARPPSALDECSGPVQPRSITASLDESRRGACPRP